MAAGLVKLGFLGPKASLCNTPLAQHYWIEHFAALIPGHLECIAPPALVRCLSVVHDASGTLAAAVGPGLLQKACLNPLLLSSLLGDTHPYMAPPAKTFLQTWRSGRLESVGVER